MKNKRSCRSKRNDIGVGYIYGANGIIGEELRS
jgi:hypothetical protein